MYRSKNNIHVITNNPCPLSSCIKYGIFVSILGMSLMLGESMFVLGHAQTLGQRPGQSSLQSNTGTGVQGVCPQLGALGGARTTLQDDLFVNCRALVQTGNELNGSGATAFSLGLTNEELNGAIQQVAGEEVVAPRTMASKTFNGQQKNLTTRLAALRAGVKGFSVSGLGFGNFQKFAGRDSADTRGLGSPQRGGGASGDGAGFSLNRLSAFVNGIISIGDKEQTSREDGFDFDSQGVTVGVDYRLLDDLVLGTAFSYSHFDADFKTSSVNSGGDSQTDGYVFSLYGTYYLKSFYVEGIGSVGWNDHDSKRNINFGGLKRTAKGDTDSTQYSFSIGVGYDFVAHDIDYGPYARLSYLRVDIDSFKESGAQGLNLEVEDQNVTSLISALGFRASKKFSWKWGVWFPQIRGEWNYEFENDSKTIKTQYVNDPFNTQLLVKTENPDRDFFRVGFTLANVSQGGTQAYFDYDTMLGFRDISNHIFTIGVRQEF